LITTIVFGTPLAFTESDLMGLFGRFRKRADVDQPIRQKLVDLAIETINGMAKTAPMTKQAMRRAQQTKP
jgi:hypothetical protein